MMEAIVVLAIIIVVLQMSFSIYQVRYYEKFIRQLVHKYSKSEGFTLHTDTAKSIFRNVIVALVADQNKKIIEAHVLKGTTIFSKFKVMEDLINVTVAETLIKETKEGKMSLTDQALLKIFEKI